MTTAKKDEWRKKEKGIYLPKAKPEVLTIPEFQFVTISGEGNPNDPFFQDYIGALYSVSYAIKMTLKKLDTPPAGYNDYTVYPLEGIWSITEEAQKNYDGGDINEDDLVFTLMIRQPDFVTEVFFQEMLELAKRKKPQKLLEEVQLEKITDGKCIQMMHIGPYKEESKSFKIMEDFAASEHLTRISKDHREIYISDFRKVAPEKLKTVLRFWVK